MKRTTFIFLICVACDEPEQQAEASIVDAGPSLYEAFNVLSETVLAVAADTTRQLAELKSENVRLQKHIDRLEAEALPNPLSISATLATSIPQQRKRKRKGNVWERTREQGVQAARMFVSEDSSAIRRISGGGTEGVLTSDHRMIMQTIYAHRNTIPRDLPPFEGWIDVMAFLSPHVGRLKEPKPDTRQRWTCRLPSLGGARPETWIDCDRNDPCDGDWRVHGPLWEAFREAVVESWMTIDFERVELAIKMKSQKWGNADDVMRTLAKYPDAWCVLNTDTKNFFMARPGEGCQLNDPATVAARTGLKVKRGP